MNILGAPSPGLRWLVVDFNSYFASCEEQDRPALRGKPVAVVPMMTDTTCAIAASYPAKMRGIKTGTKVSEARQLCPDLILVVARPKLYLEYHHRLLEAIESCLPIEDVMSIDEVACRLDKIQCQPHEARQVAFHIKEEIRKRVGACLTCSIGVASNRLLAKLASDMQKPDGLVLLEPERLPGTIRSLQIEDICGIGRHMALRLRQAGLDTIDRLWEADSDKLRRVWGGVVGARFHALLHGADLPSPVRPRRSIGHQHVLAPEHRTLQAASRIVCQLLEKAAERMRREGFYCCRLITDIKWTGDLGYWVEEQKFRETQDTHRLSQLLIAMWRTAPSFKPLRIGVTLSGLVAVERHQLDLFEKPVNEALTRTLDQLNAKYGKGTVAYGTPLPSLRKIETKISFQRVPDLREY